MWEQVENPEGYNWVSFRHGDYVAAARRGIHSAAWDVLYWPRQSSPIQLCMPLGQWREGGCQQAEIEAGLEWADHVARRDQLADSRECGMLVAMAIVSSGSNRLTVALPRDAISWLR